MRKKVNRTVKHHDKSSNERGCFTAVTGFLYSIPICRQSINYFRNRNGVRRNKPQHYHANPLVPGESKECINVLIERCHLTFEDIDVSYYLFKTLLRSQHSFLHDRKDVLKNINFEKEETKPYSKLYLNYFIGELLQSSVEQKGKVLFQELLIAIFTMNIHQSSKERNRNNNSLLMMNFVEFASSFWNFITLHTSQLPVLIYYILLAKYSKSLSVIHEDSDKELTNEIESWFTHQCKYIQYYNTKMYNKKSARTGATSHDHDDQANKQDARSSYIESFSPHTLVKFLNFLNSSFGEENKSDKHKNVLEKSILALHERFPHNFNKESINLLAFMDILENSSVNMQDLLIAPFIKLQSILRQRILEVNGKSRRSDHGIFSCMSNLFVSSRNTHDYSNRFLISWMTKLQSSRYPTHQVMIGISNNHNNNNVGVTPSNESARLYFTKVLQSIVINVVKAQKEHIDDLMLLDKIVRGDANTSVDHIEQSNSPTANIEQELVQFTKKRKPSHSFPVIINDSVYIHASQYHNSTLYNIEENHTMHRVDSSNDDQSFSLVRNHTNSSDDYDESALVRAYPPRRSKYNISNDDHDFNYNNYSNHSSPSKVLNHKTIHGQQSIELTELKSENTAQDRRRVRRFSQEEEDRLQRIINNLHSSLPSNRRHNEEYQHVQVNIQDINTSEKKPIHFSPMHNKNNVQRKRIVELPKLQLSKVHPSR